MLYNATRPIFHSAWCLFKFPNSWGLGLGPNLLEVTFMSVGNLTSWCLNPYSCFNATENNSINTIQMFSHIFKSLFCMIPHVPTCQDVLVVGISHNFSLSIKSHILDNNGVWYSSFWSERSINPLINPLNWTSNDGAQCGIRCPWGQHLEPKKFWGFIDPSDQNQLYHTPLQYKVWDLVERKK